METKIRVLLADASEDFRALLRDTLRAEGDMEVVGAAADGAEALTLLELRLFTPDQYQADQIAEQILNNPSALYHDVIQAMMRKHEDQIDLSDN